MFVPASLLGENYSFLTNISLKGTPYKEKEMKKLTESRF